MDYVMVDVESDGPCPGLYSMTELGAVAIKDGLPSTFYRQIKLDTDQSNPETLRSMGWNRQTLLTRENAVTPYDAMSDFQLWLLSNCLRPRFISDNNGFDWQFVNYYFWKFLKVNPFGHSSDNLGNIYKGLLQNVRANFREHRNTRHDHSALNDAIGNAEAMIVIKKQFSTFGW